MGWIIIIIIIFHTVQQKWDVDHVNDLLLTAN